MAVERVRGGEVIEMDHFKATQVKAWVIARLKPKEYENVEVGYELTRDVLEGETPLKAIKEMSTQVMFKFEEQCDKAFKAIGCELGDR